MSDVDRPTEGTYVYFQLCFQFVQNVERVATLTIEFVDKHNYRCVAHTTHLHEFASLCFNTFRNIDYDNYAIYCCQCAVRIFGEVLVTRGIENIYLVIAVIESHDRSSDRDTALLLYLHPVRSGGLFDFIRFYSSGNVNSSSEKK